MISADYNKIRVRYYKTYVTELFFKGVYELKYDIVKPWCINKKSKFIEQFIYRIPGFPFYADWTYDDGYNVSKLNIILGSNRLLTLHEFFKNGLELNLEKGNELNSKTFNMLNRSLQRQFEETVLELYIIEPETPPELKLSLIKDLKSTLGNQLD